VSFADKFAVNKKELVKEHFPVEPEDDKKR
jgi:hypothetical protein